MGLGEMVGRLLPAMDQAFPTAVLEELTRFLADAAGAEQVSLWLADYGQDVLAALDGPAGTDDAQHQGSADGPVGEAYTAQRTVTVVRGHLALVHTPITLRGDRIGVLRTALPLPLGDDMAADLADVALTLAYVLSVATRYTDAFEQARRRKPLSVAAEMQWSVLPARAFATAEFALAGTLIPAYEVGGDLYDFCADPDRLSLAVIDAMGHGARASLLAAVASQTLRNARRTSADVVAQVAAADRAVSETFAAGEFVTGVAIVIDLDTGACRFVNAGHPPPFRVRAGSVDTLAGSPNAPMGMLSDTTFRPIDEQLQPDDRLVLVSDGVVEGRLDDDGEYGDVHLAEQIAAVGGLEPQQAVEAIRRHLVKTVGDRLHDDATIVILDWHGPLPAHRHP